uniref:THAP-type domain-containing protein n=1 Tax=Astyanax mexicanus TaxID=7994 RepID=A0A3B1JKU5_ASTMX
MVHTCVVSGCRNRRTPGTALSFYRFPRDPERKQRWIAAVNREGWMPNEGSRLCSTHFISRQVKNPRSPDYVPSVFTSAPLSPNIKEANAFEPYDKQEAQVEAANALLFLQGQGRLKEGHSHNHCQGDPESAASSLNSYDEEEEDDDDDDDDEREEESVLESEDQIKQEIPLRNICTQSVNYEASLNALRKENIELRGSLAKMSLTETSFRNDPQKVQFYTGLPNYFVFETVMWLLVPHMKGDKNAKLSTFQQLLLTLMRLRLDLRNQDLAYRFGVKVATVTRTVHRVINIMFTTLVPTAVYWPSRLELRKNLPAAVKCSHPDCAVIIDCFTVSLEKAVSVDVNPHCAASAADMVPQSPHKAFVSELKYVIGVAPQGVVMFVSRGSPGNVSDKTLVQSSGLLCKLLPGDVVLAERDFDIRDLVSACRAELKITSSDHHGEIFTGDQHLREQASLVTVERLNVYNHVGRVIQMVKKRYSMLTGPVESPFTVLDRSSGVTTFDKIVQVACALNNLCISAVPLE